MWHYLKSNEGITQNVTNKSNVTRHILNTQIRQLPGSGTRPNSLTVPPLVNTALVDSTRHIDEELDTCAVEAILSVNSAQWSEMKSYASFKLPIWKKQMISFLSTETNLQTKWPPQHTHHSVSKVIGPLWNDKSQETSFKNLSITDTPLRSVWWATRLRRQRTSEMPVLPVFPDNGLSVHTSWLSYSGLWRQCVRSSPRHEATHSVASSWWDPLEWASPSQDNCHHPVPHLQGVACHPDTKNWPPLQHVETLADSMANVHAQLASTQAALNSLYDTQSEMSKALSDVMQQLMTLKTDMQLQSETSKALSDVTQHCVLCLSWTGYWHIGDNVWHM